MKVNKKKIIEVISSVIKNKDINASTYDSMDTINIILNYLLLDHIMLKKIWLFMEELMM